jgi:hypothetical protein
MFGVRSGSSKSCSDWTPKVTVSQNGCRPYPIPVVSSKWQHYPYGYLSAGDSAYGSSTTAPPAPVKRVAKEEISQKPETVRKSIRSHLRQIGL